jgi:hypothetical protein
MTILIPSLAVAFTAACIWLGIRIINRRERWAKWTLAALAASVAMYPLSSGPWARYWLMKSDSLDGFYEPLLLWASNDETWLASLYNAYLGWWMAL